MKNALQKLIAIYNQSVIRTIACQFVCLRVFWGTPSAVKNIFLTLSQQVRYCSDSVRVCQIVRVDLCAQVIAQPSTRSTVSALNFEWTSGWVNITMRMIWWPTSQTICVAVFNAKVLLFCDCRCDCPTRLVLGFSTHRLLDVNFYLDFTAFPHWNTR